MLVAVLYKTHFTPNLVLPTVNDPHFMSFKGGGGGGEGAVHVQKIWKHYFKTTGDPEDPPSGSTFWSGLEAPDS